MFVVNSLVKANNLPAYISIEDLNVSGMMKNRHLSKAIQKQNFYYFRTKLLEKCNKYNVEVRVIDRYYPSSKTCNVCGAYKSDLKLSDRTYVCPCGNSIDRDLNASMNIRDCKIYKIAS
jgi:putative transposase